ncbi:MAG: EAL domain-containing protein [Deltaproteobacteria bacterium]|nr:EAL domain-containing protein [Deltaproteobacteria bacterium]
MHTPLRVLVVENSMEKVHLLLDVLRNGGYEPTWERVETEHDMAIGLETQAWDIVLATNALPHLNALAALQVLQTRGLELPLFVVADRMDDAAVAAVMKAGARDCVMKENLARLIPAIERELQHTQDRYLRKTQAAHFYTLIENLHDLAIVMTEDGTIHYTSRSSERILGYQPELLAGRNFLTYVHSEDVSVVQHVIGQAAQQSGATQLVKFRVRSSTGKWRRLEVSGAAFCGEKELLRIALTAHDVTESEAQIAALKHQSLHDELTGLPNRTLLDTELAAAVRTAHTGGKKGISLLYLDLDRFQVVNDTFGYRWGDFLLQQVAPRLQGALRKADTVARVNGDEFAVLLSNIGDASGAIRIARRLLHLLEAPFQIEGHKVNVSASIGISLCPEHGTDAETLLQRAARAVHQAKRTGIGYALYSAEQEELYNPTRLLLLHDLRQAPEQEQLLLHYQPKVEMKSGAIHQVEALIRWQHPQRGILPPDDFLPLAEESGLMRPLSQWVLNEAIRQCRVWDRDGLHLRVAVNLSMRDLQDTQLPQRIAGLLTAWGLDPASLEVEVTETAIAADMEKTRQSLAELHQMGVRIAIDDFGTGYSSLAHLRQLPVDTVKIDKSFVHGLTKNDNDTAIVRATIELGHDLGLQVVAEGVEEQTTWDTLAALGCDLVQGYLISHPLPAVALQDWLSAAGGQLSPLVTTAASSRQQGR